MSRLGGSQVHVACGTTGEVLETIETGLSIPHNYVLWVEIDGNDAWVGTSKGLGWAIGPDYYAGLKQRPAAGIAEAPPEPDAVASSQRGTP